LWAYQAALIPVVVASPIFRSGVYSRRQGGDAGEFQSDVRPNRSECAAPVRDRRVIGVNSGDAHVATLQ